VTATTDSTDENLAAQLPNQLAYWISGRGSFQTPGVEQAFRSVSRHKFLPGHPREDAYSRKPVVTQRAPDGRPASSAGSPNLVAQMLAVPIGSGEGSLASVIPHSAPPGCWPGNG
jgi:hypothetical protein